MLLRSAKVLFVLLIVVVITTPTICNAALSSPNPSRQQPSLLPPGIRFRTGSKPDEFQIATTMVRELMNPLGIDSNRFIIATKDDNKLVGWAQLRPIGPALTNPNTFNAPPGSGDYERDVVEEEIWDDFDEADFPVGFASLPWTKEYRAYSEGARRRREKRLGAMEKMDRAAERDEGRLWELASVYVMPDWRGRGIGTELVRKVMARHVVLNRIPSDVYLLTLASTERWYESLGYGRTDNPPDSMGMEMVVGGIVTRVIGSELICMRYDGGDGSDV